jgi:hypothetical protein
MTFSKFILKEYNIDKNECNQTFKRISHLIKFKTTLSYKAIKIINVLNNY